MCQFCMARSLNELRETVVVESEDCLDNFNSSSFASLDTLSSYLTEGFHSDSSSFYATWNLSDSGINAKSGEISYSLGSNWYDADGINSNHAALTRYAFQYLENITGIKFTETSDGSSADIGFGNENGGAYAGTSNVHYYNYEESKVYYKTAYVNISPDWYSSSPTENDYLYQTILHEIGHILGLGHQGGYNGSANFPTDADFGNDCWSYSMMSYFSQSQNTNIDADYAFLQSCMAVDLLALDDLYGDQSYGGTAFGTSNAFTGDTTYGFNTTISASDDYALSNLSENADTNAFCIVDGAGNDTLDCSGWLVDQVIDLTVTSLNDTAPTTSNIAGLIGNLTLAVDTVIENAVGGSGDDIIRGNQYDNYLSGGDGDDNLYGGGGDDVFDWEPDNRGGADTFYGGDGDDLYVIHDLDTIVELDGGGEDSVQTFTTFTLSNYVENLTLLGSSDINGYAARSDGVANTLKGNSGNNILSGYSGNDIFYAGDGDDDLEGGDGTDYLLGQGGDDNLWGGNGGDFFYLSYSYGADIIWDYDESVDSLYIFDGDGELTSTEYQISYDTDGYRTYTLSDSSSLTLFEIYNNGPSGSLVISGTEREGSTLSITNTLSDGDGLGSFSYQWLRDGELIDGATSSTYLLTQDDVFSEITVTVSYTDGFGTEESVTSAATDDIDYGTILVRSVSTALPELAHVLNLTLQGSSDIYGYGNSLNNSITGNSGNNTLKGNNGNDILSGMNGNDTLNGGDGDDILDGGDGDDIMSDGLGNDTLRGGAGNDLFINYGNTDTFDGGDGTDKLFTKLDDEYIASIGLTEKQFVVGLNLETGKHGQFDITNLQFTGVGLDTLISVEDFEIDGNFDIYAIGDSNANTITGDEGDDTIKGGDGDDILDGGSGNDKVYGGAGNDKIDLGSGNDYVKAGGGVESFIGGSGTDYISYYDSTGGVTVNLATNKMSGSWAGNDTISGFESISGSKTGADTITGTSGANTIKTYGGNDKVYGGAGNDKIDLGSGNDYVKAGGGVESFIGGSGTDYISYYDSTGGVTVNLATNKMSGSWAGNDTISGFESISGSKTGADTITGTSGANTIKTYGGNDKVYGGAGNDKIDLGSGNDYVKAGGGVESFIGGSGTDYISYYDSTGGVTVNLATNKMSGSWAGNDTISGFESISGSKTGADTITGTSGANTIKTYGGNDKVYGGAGNDKIDLGSGNDYVKAGGGVESFIGGSGTDYISYYDSTGGVTVNLATNKMSGSWAGNDTISGFESISGSKTGADTITGTAGANTIKTYGGNDKVYGGAGNDKIDLGSGNDYVKAGGGVESFIGGSGTDYISYYDSTGGVTVNLATNKMSGSWAGNDTISGFESISGSKTGADTITGTSGANTIKTYGGNDKVYGGAGNDKIDLGSGNDYVKAGGGVESFIGGSGTDYISYYDSTGGVTVNLATNKMSGSWAGNDTISGFESISGSKTGADTITGTSGANTIKTYGGNDKVYGGAGNDKIEGGSGKDTIEGGAGRDYMYAGNDSDRDVFIFRDIDETATGSQRDRIYQFDSGEDDIDLSFIDANEDSAGDQSFKFSSYGARANSVWAQDSGSNVLVRGDVNGDKIHDFEIYVASVDDLYVYDFIL